MKPPGKKILVIPDAHARPDIDNSRFDVLGKFIVDKQPDIVISIGDWADMGSLCSHDKATLSSEGRRYKEDIEASVDALDRTMTTVRTAYRRSKRKLPEFHILYGNHENRINRVAKQLPEFFGHITTDDLKFREYGWAEHQFLIPLVIEDVLFQHYLPSGAMGRPIGGVNHARTLVVKAMQSTVVGHSHERGFWETTRADGRKLFGLIVGCYDEGEHEYASGTQQNWWSGLVMLHEVQNGSAEPAFFSMDYLKRKYT